ncbi:MAG: alkaline phosphatase [Paramuribaculum sp.]|nr:alkaline phosphatase [Paramuribaculum sp.]
MKTTRGFLSMIALLTAVMFSFQANAAKPKHVIFIGLDGWGGYSMPKADMPTVKGLMDSGAWTLKKRSVLPSSSAINWASLFMGLPTEGHGYTEWGSKSPEIPPIDLGPNGMPSTIFTLMKDQRAEEPTAAIYEWQGIAYLVDTLAITYHANVPVGENNNSSAITEAGVKLIKDYKPTLMVITYDNPDHVGHADGHDTQAYYDILNYLDGEIAKIISATKEAGIFDDTVFIITADHGGTGKGHGGKNLAEMNTPLIMSGPGIKQAGELKGAYMQYDVTATMATLLGLTQPQSWVGRPIVEALD